MKNKIVLFTAVFLFQIFVLVSLVTFSQRIKSQAIKDGNIVTLSCRVYDPYHPFKGRYVQLVIEDSSSPYAETHNQYYLQESYADIVDALSWSDFNALEPQLELYVDKKGRAVQKALTLMYEGERIDIEEYCKRMEKK